MSVTLGLGLLLLALGLALGALSLTVFVRRRKLLRTGAKTFGMVTEMRWYMDPQEGRMYTPTVTFTTPMGETRAFTSKVGTFPPRYHVGQQVAVVYDPDNPQHANIVSFMDLWFMPLFCGGFSSLFLLVGLILVLVNK